MTKITLAENFRAIFYVPFYALRVLGIAADEGVQIEWLAPGTPGSSIDGVKSGAIDLTFGGPMRVLQDHDRTPANGESLVCFGEVVTRDPFCLVGKVQATPFQLPMLAKQRLGVVSEVPTPWYCLQADLRDAGVDVAGMMASGNVKTGLTMAEQVRAVAQGTLDVCQIFEPFVSQALEEGVGSVLYAASSRGPTDYTTFICSRDGLARHHESFAALTRALHKLQDWMAANGPTELARIAAPFFPDIAPAIFHASVARYYREGVWAFHPDVSETGFARLAHSLHTGGFIATRATYGECVHLFNTFPKA